MSPDILYSLIQKQLQGSLTEEERTRLQAWVSDDANRESVETALEMVLVSQEPDAMYQHEQFDHLLHAVLEADKPAKKSIVKTMVIYRWIAAASVLLMLAVAAYFFLNEHKKTIPPQNAPEAAIVHDALPGQEGAILTLADGTKINLDSNKTGIVDAGGVKAVIRNGELAYESVATGKILLSYNTMTTPRGRQYSLQLPDGSKAWLNAGSSITYPVQFTGTQRQVSIKGEVYFEIAHNEAKPFIVTVNNSMQVEVVGTHFNINAYEDNPMIATTLLEGKVKVINNEENGLLKPGEQMLVNDNRMSRKSNVNTDAIMAWKDGMFNFNNTNFALVMNELQRWYDVDVVYEGKVPSGSLSGEFPRTLLLSEVLRILELSGLHYRIENKKLIISAR